MAGAEGATVRVSGREVTYRGKVHPVRFVGADWIAVPYDGPGPGDPAYPDAVEYEAGERPSWVKLRRDALDRNVQIKVTAQWHGQRVSVMKEVGDGRVVVHFVGPPAFADEHGLSGDQYNGWAGRVPESELEEIRVEEKEVPR